MRSFGIAVAIACALPFAVSCGGTLREDVPERDNRSGGASSPGVTNLGDAAAPPPVACQVPQGTAPATRNDCAELRERLVVTDPVVTDEDGDGRVAPGDRVHLTVSLADRSGFGFNDYPGLSVELLESDGRATALGGTQLYAILACQKIPVETTVTLGKELAHGATVTLVARVTNLSNCEGTSTLAVPLVVE